MQFSCFSPLLLPYILNVAFDCNKGHLPKIGNNSKTNKTQKTMNRIAITTEGLEGHWFDADKAEYFDQETWWNGNNHISKVTGCQFRSEALYFTKSGKWIKQQSSMHQNEKTSYEAISENEAVVWFLKQSLELPEQLKGLDSQYEL